MAEETGQAGQVLGAVVKLTAWDPAREGDIRAALTEIDGETPDLSKDELPLVVLATPSRELAEVAYDRIEEAGGTVEIAREWMAPEAEAASREKCPNCGSEHTQVFTFAGQVARVNRKCNDCGHLFKVRSTRA